MIYLYQLYWSHYVEKVRWALDYKGIPWAGIEINAFSKKALSDLSGNRFVPAIFDPATNAALGDSSPIIRYLEQQYPASQTLFPGAEQEKSLIYRWMVWLDSELGPGARRLGYTQVILESPTLLAKLFLPAVWKGLLTLPIINRISSAVIGMVLMQRFRFHRNRDDRIFERLEALLIKIAQHLEGRTSLVGEQFSGADLTLACLLRPLRIVPYFRQHPALAGLFQWQEELLNKYGRETEFIYETALGRKRNKRGWSRGAVTWIRYSRSKEYSSLGGVDPPELETATNDQQPVYSWDMLLAPLRYLKLRHYSGIGKLYA